MTNLHPVFAAALAPFAPPMSILRRKPEPVEWEEGACSNCSGSGEGLWDGGTCTVCKGSGSQMYPVEVETNEEE